MIKSAFETAAPFEYEDLSRRSVFGFWSIAMGMCALALCDVVLKAFTFFVLVPLLRSGAGRSVYGEYLQITQMLSTGIGFFLPLIGVALAVIGLGERTGRKDLAWVGLLLNGILLVSSSISVFFILARFTGQARIPFFP